ncbi:hypothetical protein AVEN_164779-1 [Araneus ventricosus]|uniref:Uncharacterized protein n=1 Tax=Araneus ventricosus TaxID=182803 RepID=A0A4Y2DP95_ARAVE|nr:hypothetical protein AVEN_164779-1 [Araneus ventricosus]
MKNTDRNLTLFPTCKIRKLFVEEVVFNKFFIFFLELLTSTLECAGSEEYDDDPDNFEFSVNIAPTYPL